MTSFEFDNVKAEKEDALWRYNMEKKLKIGFRLTGFFLAFFLFLTSWFPSFIPVTFDLEIAGNFCRRFVSAFNQPLFTFFLVNFIILVVYMLSRPKQTQKQDTSTDIYDEYFRSLHRSIPTSAAATKEISVENQIIFEEKSSSLCAEKLLEMTVDSDTIREANFSLSPTTTDRTVLNKTKPVVCSSGLTEKGYRRSRSMVSESRKQRPMEFRRSESAIGGGEPARKSMDEMSNEEFRLSIDSFIAERKKIQLQENSAHYKSRQVKCMRNVL